ncbi:MAG: hypothetical protein CR217_00665 [Beijerinckiaceae bacterium]|nr:MAG: hypothetical protein CR217_00665 [Beijerinckiaceae bacterium]
MFTRRFEGRNDSRVASRLDHAGAFEKASAVGSPRGISDPALSNPAAPGLSSRFAGRRGFAA